MTDLVGVRRVQSICRAWGGLLVTVVTVSESRGCERTNGGDQKHPGP